MNKAHYAGGGKIEKAVVGNPAILNFSGIRVKTSSVEAVNCYGGKGIVITRNTVYEIM